jgi:hypothetical protein
MTFKIYSDIKFPELQRVYNKVNDVVNVKNISSSAFGDLITVHHFPEISLLFNYGPTNKIKTKNANSGNILYEDSLIKLNTGTTVNSYSEFKSKQYLNYQPGFGVCVRFSAIFDTQITDNPTEQDICLGDDENSLGFYYTNNDMNIRLRRTGQFEKYNIDVVSPPTISDNILLTLNNIVYTIPVTASTDNCQTAIEIYNFLVSNVTFNTLFDIYLYGNQINIVCVESKPLSTFSIDIGTTGSNIVLNRINQGVSRQEILISRNKWNIDKCDGTGILPVINWGNGNVYQIKFQWLGFGNLEFFIENPETSEFILVHKHIHANTSNLPSMSNPSFQFMTKSQNLNNTVNITTSLCSVLVSNNISNYINPYGNVLNHLTTKTIGTTEENLISFYNPLNINGITNKSPIKIIKIIITSSKASNFKIYKNNIIHVNSSWDKSGKIYFDESSTTSSQGDLILIERNEKQDKIQLLPISNIQNEIFVINPGDIITFTGISDVTGNIVNILVDWIETY